MGSAENKLFVASHRGGDGHRGASENDILQQCSEIAGRCGGRVYFCFVSHLNDWESERALDPVLHEWTAGGWQEVVG